MFEWLTDLTNKEYLIKNPRTGKKIRATIHAIILNNSGLMFKMMNKRRIILAESFSESELEELNKE